MAFIYEPSKLLVVDVLFIDFSYVLMLSKLYETRKSVHRYTYLACSDLRWSIGQQQSLSRLIYPQPTSRHRRDPGFSPSSRRSSSLSRCILPFLRFFFHRVSSRWFVLGVCIVAYRRVLITSTTDC